MLPKFPPFGFYLPFWVQNVLFKVWSTLLVNILFSQPWRFFIICWPNTIIWKYKLCQNFTLSFCQHTLWLWATCHSVKQCVNQRVLEQYTHHKHIWIMQQIGSSQSCLKGILTTLNVSNRTYLNSHVIFDHSQKKLFFIFSCSPCQNKF